MWGCGAGVYVCGVGRYVVWVCMCGGWVGVWCGCTCTQHVWRSEGKLG